MYCVKCGGEVKEGQKFCKNCGNRIVIIKNMKVNDCLSYEGKLHKCPNCGENLGSFIIKCPSCGYEIRNNEISKSINEFSKRILECNNNNKLIQIIANYPIPNTKEDLKEFFILAKINLKRYDKNGDGVISQNEDKLFCSWLQLIDQCIEKAKVLFELTDEWQYFKKNIEEINEIKDEKKSQEIRSGFIRDNKNKLSIIIGLMESIVLFILSLYLEKYLGSYISVQAFITFVLSIFIGYQIIKIRVNKIYLLTIVLGYIHILINIFILIK